MYRFCFACIIIIVFTIIRQIHIIQLNSYNFDQQLIWYRKNYLSFAMNVVLFISAILYFVFRLLVVYYIIIIALFVLLIENLPRKQKKKLVYTSRIKRLIFICIILFALIIIPSLRLGNEMGLKYIVYVTSLAPLIIFVAYCVSLPIENGIRRKFMNEAKTILDSNDNIYTIGITGSFGKTSTKFFLDRLLKIKYLVCKTPESYNTAMGATLTIKNYLKNIDDIFICEMGARRRGDIREICDIVSPSGAIITDVGNMHLDTFKTIDNVTDTKFELFDNVYKSAIKPKLVDNCIILLNGDNSLIRDKVKCYSSNDKKVYFYGLNGDNDFYADEIALSAMGTRFNFKSNVRGIESFAIQTRLLGEYNIMNLLAAISYALLLKVSASDIVREVKLIESVPHRLQLLDGDKNNLIIDDAYNSNPKGAKNAVKVLSKMDGYTKVLITPGMVELADKQELENMEFAKFASEMIDYAIVVGKTNKSSLESGFNEKLSSDRVIYFDNIEDAIRFAKSGINGKKVILLENDLSDNY